jgi:hypothetical protein
VRLAFSQVVRLQIPCTAARQETGITGDDLSSERWVTLNHTNGGTDFQIS